MKLCSCGCGQEVKSKNAKYIYGHHNRDPRVKQKKRQTCLKNYGVDNPSKHSFYSEKRKSLLV